MLHTHTHHARTHIHTHHTHTHTHTYTHTTHKHTHRHRHKHTHTYTHAQTHTHKHTPGIQKCKICVYVTVFYILIPLLPKDICSHRHVTGKVMDGTFKFGSLADYIGQLIQTPKD